MQDASRRGANLPVPCYDADFETAPPKSGSGLEQLGIHKDGKLALLRGDGELERFRFKCLHRSGVQGGFFLRKKPLGRLRSVKSRIENAVVVTIL